MNPENQLYNEDWIIGGCGKSKPPIDSYTNPDVVAAYDTGRADYSPEILNRILSKFNSSMIPLCRDICIDVGCGSGQFTRIIAPHFTKVIGIDPSEPQILLAKASTPDKNVEYRLGQCLDLGISDLSANLITVATAIHWCIPIEKFLTEVDRCLVPGGIFTYFAQFMKLKGNLCKSNQILCKYFFGSEYLGDYGSKEHGTVLIDEYSSIPKLYENTESFRFDFTLQYTIDKIVKCFQSTDMYGALKDQDSMKLKNVEDSFIQELKSAFPPSIEQKNMENTFDFQIQCVGYICQKPIELPN